VKSHFGGRASRIQFDRIDDLDFQQSPPPLPATLSGDSNFFSQRRHEALPGFATISAEGFFSDMRAL
jgi:hypothetical protein